MSAIPVTNGEFFVFDEKARQIYVGDTLDWQKTAGAYGQTEQGRGTVTEARLIYGCIVTDNGLVNTNWEWKPADGVEGLYCRHENYSYEHGHKTWARIAPVSLAIRNQDR